MVLVKITHTFRQQISTLADGYLVPQGRAWKTGLSTTYTFVYMYLAVLDRRARNNVSRHVKGKHLAILASV